MVPSLVSTRAAARRHPFGHAQSRLRRPVPMATIMPRTIRRAQHNEAARDASKHTIRNPRHATRPQGGRRRAAVGRARSRSRRPAARGRCRRRSWHRRSTRAIQTFSKTRAHKSREMPRRTRVRGAERRRSRRDEYCNCNTRQNEPASSSSSSPRRFVEIRVGAAAHAAAPARVVRPVAQASPEERSARRRGTSGATTALRR